MVKSYDILIFYAKDRRKVMVSEMYQLKSLSDVFCFNTLHHLWYKHILRLLRICATTRRPWHLPPDGLSLSVRLSAVFFLYSLQFFRYFHEISNTDVFWPKSKCYQKSFGSEHSFNHTIQWF